MLHALEGKEIIQGGMGVYISSPFLARAVSQSNGLGTVSGTAAYIILARILQRGDPGGHFRKALSRFPFPEVAERVLERYFVDGGIREGRYFKFLEGFTLNPPRDLIDLTICANFAFVWLAKEGHNNPVSINYLEHVKMPHIYSLVGAMLASVDAVTMGAGIPLQVPVLLDAIARGDIAKYRVDVLGTDGRYEMDQVTMSFDAQNHFGKPLPPMLRPAFIPIVSTHVLAMVLQKRVTKAGSSIEGIVVETPVAGGHNAPPRDKTEVYGERDEVNYAVMREIGLPFWIAGGFASPLGLAEAKKLGATGIQCGSIFALSEDSGMNPERRREIRRIGFMGKLEVVTDFKASPTGFPFKVVRLPGSTSEEEIYKDRPRNCSQRCLVTPVRQNDGEIDYRCPAEPPRHYVEKGGKIEDTKGSKCICNGLVALASTIGEDGTVSLGDGEPPIVTMGDHVEFLRSLMRNEGDSYTAEKALRYLLDR